MLLNLFEMNMAKLYEYRTLPSSSIDPKRISENTFLEMSKETKMKKHLVRNTNMHTNDCLAVQNSPEIKKVHFLEDGKILQNKVKALNSPEFFTILQYKNEIHKIRNQQNSSCSTSQQPAKYYYLNFSPQEKIFDRLIDLNANDKSVAKFTRTDYNIQTTLNKDIEPDPKKFLRCLSQAEYNFFSNSVPHYEINQPFYDGRSIYKELM